MFAVVMKKLSFIFAALAVFAQSCTAQGLLSSGINLQGSASLDSLGQLGGGLNLLQDGVRAIGTSAEELGSRINLSVGNIASAANDLGNVVAEQLLRILEHLHAGADAAAKKASDRVEAAMASASASVDAAVGKAKALGQAVAPCLEARVNLKKIQNLAVDLIAGCVGERIAAARDVLRRAAEGTLTAVAEGASLRARVDAQCGAGVASAGALRCASSIVPQALARIAVDTRDVLSQVSRAQAVVLTLKVELESCVASKAADAILAAGRVALEVGKCAQANLANDGSVETSDPGHTDVDAGLSVSLNVGSDDETL